MITAQTVDDTWKRIAGLAADEAMALGARMRAQQPSIIAYLLSKAAPPFVEHEEAILFYVGTVVCEIMRQAEQPPLSVTAEQIEAAEASNYALLTQLFADSEGDMAVATRAMLETHAQPQVLRYIASALMEDNQDPADPPIREEYRGLAFAHLKTVLDALVAAASSRDASAREQA